MTTDKNEKREVSTHEHNNVREFKCGYNRTPSWKRYGPGYKTLRVTTHANAKWIEFDAVEQSLDKGQGGGHTKRTMITLDEASARTFFKWLAPLFATEKT